MNVRRHCSLCHGATEKSDMTQLRHRHPPDRRGRALRRRRLPGLPAPRRGARLRERLDPGAGARRLPRPRTDGDDGVRRRLHVAPAPRLRGARQHAAQPGPPRPQRRLGRSAERRPPRGRHRHRRRLRQFAAFGVDRATFVARFNEGLELMRKLWTEARVDHDGRFWQLSGAAMEPKPVQRPHPPIWFGGAHPAALRRAVAARRRVLRCRLPDDGRVRRPGRHGPRGRWRRSAAIRRRSASPSGCT